MIGMGENRIFTSFFRCLFLFFFGLVWFIFLGGGFGLFCFVLFCFGKSPEEHYSRTTTDIFEYNSHENSSVRYDRKQCNPERGATKTTLK